MNTIAKNIPFLSREYTCKLQMLPCHVCFPSLMSGALTSDKAESDGRHLKCKAMGMPLLVACLRICILRCCYGEVAFKDEIVQSLMNHDLPYTMCPFHAYIMSKKQPAKRGICILTEVRIFGWRNLVSSNLTWSPVVLPALPLVSP